MFSVAKYQYFWHLKSQNDSRCPCVSSTGLDTVESSVPPGDAVDQTRHNNISNTTCIELHQSVQGSQVYVFGTHMFSLSLQVLWVPHQLPIHFVPHVLSNDLSLTCVVIQLIQYGVEWQTGCEPAGKKKKINEENGKHDRFISFIYFYWITASMAIFRAKSK